MSKFYTEEEMNSWISKANKNLKDKTGATNGSVTVLKHYSKEKWFCRCHCGKIFIASPANVKKGSTRSCGCTRGAHNKGKSCDEVSQLLYNRKPEYEVLERGEGATDKWKISCTICNHTFSYAPAQIYGKRGRTPCKCSPSYRRSKKEWDAELIAMCSVRGYQYQGTEKQGYTTYVNLRCPKHDHTWRANTKHSLNGIGCNKCGGDTTALKNKTITTESVLVEFRQTHGDKYNYSKVEYNKWEDKLTIICPHHGEFQQRYKDHKKAIYGCPSCAKYGFKPYNPAYLYVLTSKDKCKVGITNNNVETRIQQINTSGKKEFTLHDKYYFHIGEEARRVETMILRESGLLFGDYIKYSGSTEVTELSNLPLVLEIIEDNL
tara:strand:+ start:1033 stop:2163 length:1131 start_codon:yes stop_codon:yes gene_type:complete